MELLSHVLSHLGALSLLILILYNNFIMIPLLSQSLSSLLTDLLYYEILKSIWIHIPILYLFSL